jgi:hypothetical protein
MKLVVIGSIGFVETPMHRLLLIPLLMLAGCDEPGTPPVPKTYCTQIGEEVCSGRSGCWNKCLKEALGCPAPLVMTTDPDDKTGKLLCRMYPIPQPIQSPVPNGMAR